MTRAYKEKKPFGQAPSAAIKDLYFLVDAASDTSGPKGRAVLKVYDPIRRAMRPVMVTKNIYSEWAKLQKWLDGRKHLPGGRATGKVRAKADVRQLALAL